MISTSQWVAASERRMMTRSTTSARAADPTRDSPMAAGSGAPAPWAVQARKAETISISPCAKLSVRVAL
jgi:hypothetical protein